MCVLWAKMQFYDIHAYEGERFSFVYSRGKKTLQLQIGWGRSCTAASSFTQFSQTCDFLRNSPSD